MPKSLGAAALGELAPTAEELHAARQVLAGASDKVLRAKMAAMSSWLKSNPDEVVKDSRGSDRRAYLEKFLVRQLRAKALEKNTTSSKTHVSSDASFKGVLWMAQEEMDDTIGPRKGKLWRESEKLPWAPCPVTGSTDDLLKVWGIPRNWQRMTEEDFNKLETTATTEGSEANAQMVDVGVDGQQAVEQPEVKKEPLTPDEQKKANEAARRQLNLGRVMYAFMCFGVVTLCVPLVLNRHCSCPRCERRS